MTIPTLFFATNGCLPPHQPQAAVARQHGGQREGDADAQKALGADGLAVFAQDADGCDVGRSADGGQVAAQRKDHASSSVWESRSSSIIR